MFKTYNCAQLPPPSPISFEGNAYENFLNFKTLWPHYCIATGLDGMSEEVKVSTLLLTIGHAAFTLLRDRLNINKVELNSCDKIFDTLEEHFKPKENNPTQKKSLCEFYSDKIVIEELVHNVKQVKMYSFLRKHTTGEATTQLHIVQIDRGMSWDEALEEWSELSGPKEGFYVSHQIRNNKPTTILAVASDEYEGVNNEDLYTIYRPNTGVQLRQETLDGLEKKYRKVEPSEAEEHWKDQYTVQENTCSHAYWRGNCQNVACEIGLRKRTYNVVSGSVLSVWGREDSVLAQKIGHDSTTQVVRLETARGLKIVGTLIPHSSVEPLREALAEDAVKITEESFTQCDELDKPVKLIFPF